MQTNVVGKSLLSTVMPSYIISLAYLCLCTFVAELPVNWIAMQILQAACDATPVKRLCSHCFSAVCSYFSASTELFLAWTMSVYLDVYPLSLIPEKCNLQLNM